MGLLHEALTGEYVAHGNEYDAKVILLPAFGRGEFGPGESNMALAEFALEKAVDLRIPIIAQLAAADAVVLLGGQDALRARVDPRNEQEEHYINTGQFFDRAKESMRKGTPALLVAQPCHMPRADREAWRKGISTIVPKDIPEVWDAHNIEQEKHCNSLAAWRRREPFVLGAYFLAGKLGVRKYNREARLT